MQLTTKSRRRSARYVYPAAYMFTPRDRTRWGNLQDCRDILAAMSLVDQLRDFGFRRGDVIFNAPPQGLAPRNTFEAPGEEDDGTVERELAPVDVSFVRPGDFLLQTTRPPMHDAIRGDRKRVERAYTDLEARMFGIWRRVFRTSSRLMMELQDEVREQLPCQLRDRGEMRFAEASEATFRLSNGRGGDHKRTAVFLLRVEEMWPGGPGLLGAFGMSGALTAIWAYRLTRDLYDLLEQPGFTMAEMEVGEIPVRFTGLGWTDSWNVEVVLQHQL